MKPFLFAILSLIVLISCSIKTNEEKNSEPIDPQEKARELIEPEVKANLINPESYEFSQLKLDSCFSDSKYNADLMMFAIKASKLYEDYKEYKSDAEEAETFMSFYEPSFGYRSAHSRQQEQKYKSEMEKALRKASAAKENILQLYKDNKQLLLNLKSGKHEFTGWVATFIYRAETAGGLKRMDEVLYFLNKDITEITNYITKEDLDDFQTEDLEDIKYDFEEELKEIFETEE